MIIMTLIVNASFVHLLSSLCLFSESFSANAQHNNPTAQILHLENHPSANFPSPTPTRNWDSVEWTGRVVCFLCWYQRFGNEDVIGHSKSLNLTNFMPRNSENLHWGFPSSEARKSSETVFKPLSSAPPCSAQELSVNTHIYKSVFFPPISS